MVGISDEVELVGLVGVSWYMVRCSVCYFDGTVGRERLGQIPGLLYI
jgi:hypothetical protein